MNTPGTTRRSNEPTDGLMQPTGTTPAGGASSAAFQPTVVIAAEIAFAALLLYMSTQPVELGQNSIAQGDPAITITIPANVAVASTELTEIEQPLRHTNN